nr:glycosyltransferase [uncultured Nocardioides sp.]
MRRERRGGAVEVLYVSTSPSPGEFDRMSGTEISGEQRVVYGLPEASFKFHNLLRQGFALDRDVHVHSLVGRPISSATHHGRTWRRRSERLAPNYVVDHVGLVNLPVAKQLGAAAACALRTAQWRFRTRHAETRMLVLDGAYVSAMPAVLLALAGSSVVRVGIFADLYSYMADVTDAAGRRVSFVHRLARRVTRTATSRLQVFVVLTAAMARVLPTDGREVLVMEGLVDHRSPRTQGTKSDQPTILYAGALKEEYGLRDLVEGFARFDRPDARLVVYGRGDYSADLERASLADPRIQFRGSLPLDEVFEEERRAWLLVNPRPVHEEFTRYSFPSKTLEYLASGSPVLTTRLPGMPEEYYPYVWTIDAPGPDGVAEALSAVFTHDPDEFIRRGQAGQAFVLDHKNNAVQAQKITHIAQGISLHG